jgi:hypothetical protein
LQINPRGFATDPLHAEVPETPMSKAKRSNKSAGTPSERTYTVGYCLPPKSPQYKPGQSGNYRGRPKGSKNMRSEMRKIYCEPITVSLKGKRRRVPVILALERAQVQRAFTDPRAAQAVLKNAKEFGAFDQNEPEVWSPSLTLSDELIERMSDTTLDELILIETERQAQREKSKKPH